MECIKGAEIEKKNGEDWVPFKFSDLRKGDRFKYVSGFKLGRSILLPMLQCLVNQKAI